MQEASGRAQPGRRPLGEGAAEAAPTAPHATARSEGARRNGPERFWARWPGRVALGLCLLVSAVGHCSMMPLEVPPGFAVKDVEGEAYLPVDLLAADPAPEPPPPPANPTSKEPDNEKEQGPAAAASVRMDPPHRDAGSRDAASDAPKDSEADDGGLDGSIPLVATRPDSGPRDPEALIASDDVRADVVLVQLTVNAEVIRAHPVGARLGYLLRGIPQWDDFMSGTDLDPVRDIDWVVISGPSLVNTAHDNVLIHYSASDAAVDRAVRIVSGKYDKGGPFDAGVRGVKAMLAHADRAERVILRPQPHILAVVPLDVARRNARVLATGSIHAHVHPGEAMNLRLVNPHRPLPEIPESVTELRMRVVPRPDSGADVFMEGDTRDAQAALEAADVIRQAVRRHNVAIIAIVTHGLFDHVEVSTDESKVKVHLSATLDQIETLATLVGDFLGVQPGAPPATTAAPSSPPSSPSKPRPAR